MNDPIQAYIKTHKKSQLAGFLLTLFLGPLGLFYSSWVAALVLCAVVVFTFYTVLVPLFCWLLSILISLFAVSKHNRKVIATANLTHARQ